MSEWWRMRRAVLRRSRLCMVAARTSGQRRVHGRYVARYGAHGEEKSEFAQTPTKGCPIDRMGGAVDCCGAAQPPCIPRTGAGELCIAPGVRQGRALSHVPADPGDVLQHHSFRRILRERPILGRVGAGQGAQLGRRGQLVDHHQHDPRTTITHGASRPCVTAPPPGPRLGSFAEKT